MKILTMAVAAFLFVSINARAQEQSARNTVVKFSPSKMIVGEILFSCERKIAEQAAIEFSFGPAISNVGIVDFGHIFGNGSNANENSLLGFATSISPRFYPLEDEDALEGFYVSPVLGFTQKNYSFSAYNNGSLAPLEDQRGHSSQTSFAFVFGTQKWFSNSFSLDMFVGSGIKKVSEQNYFLNYDSWTEPIQAEPFWVKETTSDVRWFITAGIKVGIGFSTKK